MIHASGNPAGLAAALRLAGIEATVLEMSWYGAQPVTLALGEAFHSRRLDLRPRRSARSRRSSAPAGPMPGALGLALSLLADPRLDVLITGDTPSKQCRA